MKGKLKGSKKQRQRKTTKVLNPKKTGKTTNSPKHKCKRILPETVKKVKSVLPSSPRKRSKVVKELMYLA